MPDLIRNTSREKCVFKYKATWARYDPHYNPGYTVVGVLCTNQ